MILLTLLAGLAFSQSTGTAVIPLEDSLKLSNTARAVRELQSGRYRQTGKPTFANGICFSDGSCQTSSSGGLASTQTWSGVNTYTSTLSVTGRLSGVYNQVASTNPSVATYSTMTITAGVNTCIEWSLKMSANASLYIHINGDDTASAYRQMNGSGINEGGTGISEGSAGGQAYFALPRSAGTQTTESGAINQGHLCIRYHPSDNTIVGLEGRLTHKATSGGYESMPLGMAYDGASAVTQVTFHSSSPATIFITGTITQSEMRLRNGL